VEYLYGDTVSDEFLKMLQTGFEDSTDRSDHRCKCQLKRRFRTKLNDLYKQLGLQNDSIRKATSRKWHTKSRIQELAL